MARTYYIINKKDFKNSKSFTDAHKAAVYMMGRLFSAYIVIKEEGSHCKVVPFRTAEVSEFEKQLTEFKV